MLEPPTRPPRRFLVAACLGTALLTASGCDAIDSVLDGGPDTPGAVEATAPALDSDSDLVEEVRSALVEAEALASAAGSSYAGLAPLASRYATLNRTHLAELDADLSASSGPTSPGQTASGTAQPPVGGSEAAARKEVLRTETALRERLLTASREAGSGALAQRFAAMAAAVAQLQGAAPADDGAALVDDDGLSPAAVDALQVVLAGEHAAVFVYGALAAQTSRTAQPALASALTRAYRAHQGRRDRLVAALSAAGATPVAAEPAYELPADLSTPSAVRTRARELEEAAASAYAYGVASTAGKLRAQLSGWLSDAAVRGVGLGAKPEPLPGL
ncbi:DUF4439 domain-containing protein [Nocardioides sp. zg-ZUI104]|uniref:DUF4439 domain-containing protein n=1 Tax=Nocardioides faecalis TaxID=2803858 RepID=UPI001BCFA6F3|nr:DUF4439 domain-containing protein [Nocardioides faecalis]MBS4752378.1 DUF4439 domain-containing protein [Nocardioides faecalis]